VNEKKEINTNRLDWHLIIGALGIIITLGSIIFGCYFGILREISSVNREIAKIETILILKGVAPSELFSVNKEEI